MKIHFLGTACGRPTAERFNSSMAFEYQGRLLMIDCGEPCTALLKRQGLSPGDVTDILITHVHADHVSGLTMLLREIFKCRNNQESPRKPDEPVNLLLPAHANPGLLDAVTIFFGTNRATDLRRLIRLGSLRDRAVFRFGNDNELVVTSLANRRDGLESYAFFVECEGFRLMHTGDLPGNFSLIEPYLDDLDVLIMEAAHLAMPEYAVLNSKRISQVIVSHIRWKYHTREGQLRQDLAKYLLNREFIIAEDGMKYVPSKVLPPKAK